MRVGVAFGSVIEQKHTYRLPNRGFWMAIFNTDNDTDEVDYRFSINQFRRFGLVGGDRTDGL